MTDILIGLSASLGHKERSSTVLPAHSVGRARRRGQRQPVSPNVQCCQLILLVVPGDGASDSRFLRNVGELHGACTKKTVLLNLTISSNYLISSRVFQIKISRMFLVSRIAVTFAVHSVAHEQNQGAPSNLVPAFGCGSSEFEPLPGHPLL
jgi:hypothetical protein